MASFPLYQPRTLHESCLVKLGHRINHASKMVKPPPNWDGKTAAELAALETPL
jgi:hypothetical protein